MRLRLQSMSRFYGLFCLCAVLIFAGSITGCGRQVSASGTELILGTVIEIKLYGTMSQRQIDTALEAALDKIRTLEHVFSVNIDGSELNYVNQNAFKEPVHVSDDLYKVIKSSLEYAKLTDGAFDPALGHLIALWDIGGTHPKVPANEDIFPLSGQHFYEHILLDENAQTVSFTNEHVMLNLGAIAKGYTADVIKEFLIHEYHIISATISLGGNVITIGSKPDGSTWRLGVANPQDPANTSAPAAIVEINDKTLVTSGDYQRYYTAPDGTVYHHILDSQTGYPAESDLSSVTIITDNSMMADALSTAVFVMGKDKGQQFIETLSGVEAIFIDRSQQLTCTDGIRPYVRSGSLTLE